MLICKEWAELEWSGVVYHMRSMHTIMDGDALLETLLNKCKGVGQWKKGPLSQWEGVKL